MRAPCHPGEGSLHLAHADGPPCDIAPSTRGNPDGVDPDSLAVRDISHPEPDAGWERRTFQLPRSDIFRSSDSVHPESIRDRHFRLPGFCTVLRCSPEASRYLPPTKLDFFSQDILCKFLFSPCNQSKILLGYFLENIFSIYIFEPM